MSHVATMELIEQYMQNPPETSVVLSILPSVAGAILAKHNHDNRGLKNHKIRLLVDDLQSREWLVTGDTIKFSKRRLLDGQNRLTACAEAGIGIITHVVFGIDDSAFALIDTGAPRSAPDVFVCMGVGNSSIIAHAISRLNSWEPGDGIRSVRSLAPYQVLGLFKEKYSDLPEHVAWGKRLQKTTGCPPSWGTTLHYAFTKAGGQDLADSFFTAWIENDARVPQVALLRRRVAQLRNMQAGSIRANVFYAMAIKAWNSVIDERPIDVSHIKWEDGEAFPRIRSREQPREEETPANSEAEIGSHLAARPGPHRIRVSG